MLIQNIEGLPPSAASASAGLAVSGTRVPEQAQPAAPAPPVAAAPTSQELARAIVRANRAMTAMSTAVQFVIDPDTKAPVVKIVDTENNEVLRQVPSQEMIDIARAIDRVQGLLLRTKV